MKFLVFCSIVLAVLMLPTAVSAQSLPIPVDTFWDLLANTQLTLQNAQNETPDNQLQAAADAADALEQVTAVFTPDGQSYPINTTSLVTELRAAEPNLDRIDSLLTTLIASRQTWPSPRFDETANAALTDILAQPEFQYKTEPSWLQKQIQNLRQRWFDFLVGLLPEGAALNIPLGNIIAVLAAIVLALIVFYATKDLFSEFTGSATLNPEDDIGGEPLTADSALKRAQDFSEGGDYRTAVRYLYLSALLLLEERGLLRYDRSQTNREYLRSVAHQPELSATLREVITVFDRVWYGFQPLAEQEYQQYARRVETLKQQRSTR
ncbi:MAG: DUF4129 domain-containing protein [Chloroflexi bacterium]|nr:DUF4129 domain-containing protein [Chloroflexota bacterium]